MGRNGGIFFRGGGRGEGMVLNGGFGRNDTGVGCGGCTSTQVPPLGNVKPKQPQAGSCAGAAAQGGKTEAPLASARGGVRH